MGLNVAHDWDGVSRFYGNGSRELLSIEGRFNRYPNFAGRCIVREFYVSEYELLVDLLLK